LICSASSAIFNFASLAVKSFLPKQFRTIEFREVLVEWASMYHCPMDGSSPTVAAFILSGGRSTRMGADKAFVMLDGRTLLERALELAHSTAPDVRIVGNAAKFSPFALVVEDLFPNCGPLGGIHAALRASNAELNLILAVDTPFVLPPLLRYLIMRARSSPAATATVPRTNDGWQPLCAIYRREFADAAERALRAGRYKIDAFFAAAETQVIDEEELITAGFSTKMFRNLNTREELEAAKTQDVSC
jgi:molybdenum cofactor guanylyltransferase